MTETDVTLRIEGVTKRFGDFTAVDDLSFNVRAGRVFGFLGPNGAGKTTTIRMIVGITAPDDGHIELFGQKMSPALQDRIGYLPEERGLYKKLKIVDQLRYFAALEKCFGCGSRKTDRLLARANGPFAVEKEKDDRSFKGNAAKDPVHFHRPARPRSAHS